MRRVRYRLTALALIITLLVPASFAYIPTMRDTGMPVPRMEYDLAPVGGTGEYTFLAEIGYLSYYFRDDRDVIAIVDSRNGYTWKTGLDIPFNTDIDDAVWKAQTDEEKLAAAVPKEDGLSTTFIGLANSLLTVEFFDDANSISRISSASQSNATSQLLRVDGKDDHYLLDVHFTALDLGIRLHIHLTGQGLRYEVKDYEMTGAGVDWLAAVILNPFLGAAGGSQIFYDPEKKDYGEPQRKPMIPGYILIPDGPGALIRFRENSVSFNRYTGSVYGTNLADATYHTSAQMETVPYKEPLAPVFGIAHGDRQAAFLFWADDGDEHLEIVVSPEGSVTKYNYAYPRFVYNQTMWQVYNRAGEGYLRLYPERNSFDLDATYRFLANDGSEDGLPADYTGMALAYREHLTATGQLPGERFVSELPIHFDFLMSDIKKDILGYRNMVTTTAEDVGNILTDLMKAGVGSINAGLLGAQRGGVTGGKPWTLAYSAAIGSQGDFRDLITDMREKGADVYFTQDYAMINPRQMLLGNNSAIHRNSWGVKRMIEYENTSVPVTEVSIARPAKSVEWMFDQAKDMKRAGATSIGIDGISSRLTSHHGTRPMNAEEAIDHIRAGVAELDMTVNAYGPNKYLWDTADRFINAPLMPTQYIIETDTVPFLQMILYGTMEMYAPYANFSFYTQSDVLRMIDYNVFPSFVLTEEPAYLLAETNSSGFYSTSYDLYRDIIIGIYETMSGVYGKIAGRPWLGRDMLAPGVALNTYGGDAKVLINYTEYPYAYEGREIPPLSAEVLGGDAG